MKKMIYRLLGLLFTAIAIIGIVTPILPTTGPLLLASWFFIHSSPALHRWLNGNRITGPYIKAYTEKRGLSLRRKILTISILWISLAFSMWFVRETPWLLLLLAAVGVGVSIHIATIRAEQRLNKDETDIREADTLHSPEPGSQSTAEAVDNRGNIA